MDKKVIIIGGGVGGLASAALLAKDGCQVELFEKQPLLGGRCNLLEARGYKFDMGPSWYLMPDVFERFFDLLGEKVADHLRLIKLDPSYRIFFKDTGKKADFYSDLARTRSVFDRFEAGAGAKLDRFLAKSARQYRIAVDNFIYKNYDSVADFFNWQMITQGLQLSVFSKMQDYVARYFKSPELQKVMQYTLVFLGSSPYNTPALYNIMSHVDFDLGVFYPQGGLYEIIKALVKIGAKHGAEYHGDSEVKKILVKNGSAYGIELAGGRQHFADLIVANSDIKHTETELLEPEQRSYGQKYWDSRVMAPSGLIMYLGVKDRIPTLSHHNLVFARDWKKNFGEIFDTPRWPTDPSFYVSCPSKTDPSVAPAGKENLFVLVPIAAGLDYTAGQPEEYAEQILATMEKEMDIPGLRGRLEYRKLFCVKDFEKEYNSYRGTALGLAHTLWQTAVFRPANRSRKIKNLFYAGCGTVPGIGVPICLISAELAGKRIRGQK